MKKAVIILSWFVLSIPCAADIIIVDDDGLADFDNIQAAIDDSNDGDTIYVFPGRYTGVGNRNIDYGGRAITVQSVLPEDPYIVAATIIDCNGGGRGFYFHSGEEADSVLDGLTITGGHANEGGGIYCHSSDPTVANCVVVENGANNKGGGVYCYLSRPTMSKCTVTRNSSNTDGGGVYCDYGGSAVISDCELVGNSAGRWGGGICARSSNPKVAACVLNGNWATYGGGTYSDGAYPDLKSCTFTGNRAATNGGGLCSSEGAPTIENCTFSSNVAESGGGGGVFGDDAWVRNCIFWGNTDSGGTIESAQIAGGTSYVYFSCVQDEDANDANIPFGGADSNNIDDNPMFVRNPDDGGDGWGVGDNDDFGDLHLESDSPCINAGDPYSWVPSGSVDIDGEPRMMGLVVDMGADEYLIKMLIVTKPEGGEVWAAGSSHEIKWESQVYEGAVLIMYITDGNDMHPIAIDVPNTGSYMWHVPEGVDSNECVVSVSPSVIDISVVCVESGVFTIHPDAAGPAVASKWESLGGDYDRMGLSENYGPELGCVKWAFETGGAVSASVTIGPNETTYVPCEDGKLYKLDSNGVLLWSYDAGTPLMSAASIGPDGTAYVGGEDGKLYAVDIDGNLRWTHTTGGFIYSSPAVGADGKVYAGSQDGTLYGLGPDGSELWSVETAGFGMLEGAIFASPTIGADGTVYVAGLYDPNLYALDPNDGSVKWVCHFDSGGWPFASPVVAEDGTIYQTLLYDPYLYAIKPNEPNAGSIIWSTHLSDTSEYSTWFEPNDFAGIRWDGWANWCIYVYPVYNDVSSSGWSEPALGPDGTVYVSFDDPYLRAVDPNGSIKWVRKFGTWSGFSVTVGSDGLIYAATEQGHLYVVKPNGDRLARFDSSNWPGFPVISADNTVVVGDTIDNTTLISYESNKVWAISGDGCEGQDPDLYWYGVEDLNGNGKVDFIDFSLLAADWLKCTYCTPKVPGSPCWPITQLFRTGDINRDYYVDFADLALLVEKWLMGY
ncbi:MAG: outer membrane protein assembly factor BamB family protein [Planctomycetota bacterium]